MSLPIPTEKAEQIHFVRYLRLKNIDHFHVPNSTWTKSIKQKVSNKAMGVSPGVPDLFLIVKDKLYAIEMKRQKGGQLRDSQKRWIKKLNEANVKTVVCNGCEEAIKFVESI